MTNAETTKRIAELKATIYQAGVDLQRVSRAMIDEDTIARVLYAADAASSEAEAHEIRSQGYDLEREQIIWNLTEAHRKLAGFGIEA